MSMSRLRLIENGQLESALTGIPDDRRRSILLRICRLAVRSTGLNDEVVSHALDRLEEGKYGDGRIQKYLEGLVDNLDEEYFDAKDKSDAGIVPATMYLELFRRARAANCVLFATQDSSLDTVSEAIYEAIAALNDAKEVRRQMDQA
jgi:hypothetical protein